MNSNVAIGLAFYTYRMANGLSPNDMAAAMDLIGMTYAHIEAGSASGPSVARQINTWLGSQRKDFELFVQSLRFWCGKVGYTSHSTDMLGMMQAEDLVRNFYNPMKENLPSHQRTQEAKITFKDLHDQLKDFTNNNLSIR